MPAGLQATGQHAAADFQGQKRGFGYPKDGVRRGPDRAVTTFRQYSWHAYDSISYLCRSKLNRKEKTMTIGIINAMQKEHEQLAALLEDRQVETHGRFSFTTGTYGGRRLVLMQSGIGKVNAAVGAVELIHHYAPTVLVNTGVAGGIDASLGVMDVVAGASVAYHDVDCGPENKPGQVQGLPPAFAADKRLLGIASSLTTSTRIVPGLICSGDQFITDREQLNLIKQRFPLALAVDMESGALAQVCHLYGVPFLSFRIISDTPGAEGHFDQYTNFWDTMADRSFAVTRSLLDALTSQL